MKKLHRILLSIVSIIGLGFSVGVAALFYPLPFLTDSIRRFQAFFPWLEYVFAGYGALISLCFCILLLIALFSPNKSNDLTIVTSKGNLRFSRQTIESAARYSFADVEGICLSKVRANINRQPEKTKIHVRLSLKDASRLVELTETIQNKIEASLRAALGIAIQSIHIKVVAFNPDDPAKKEVDGDVEKGSRVI